MLSLRGASPLFIAFSTWVHEAGQGGEGSVILENQHQHQQVLSKYTPAKLRTIYFFGEAAIQHANKTNSFNRNQQTNEYYVATTCPMVWYIKKKSVINLIMAARGSWSKWVSDRSGLPTPNFPPTRPQHRRGWSRGGSI